MNFNKFVTILFILVLATIGLSGCIVNETPDMKLHNYQGTVISMDLNHAMTTTFCQENGYNSAYQWIIGSEHSGQYGRRVGYDIWGGDGRFNTNDVRVHVDCKGGVKLGRLHQITEVQMWLNQINISIDDNQLSNATYDQFCQQTGMNFRNKEGNTIECWRSYDIVKEYTPQEIARWYIERGDTT